MRHTIDSTRQSTLIVTPRVARVSQNNRPHRSPTMNAPDSPLWQAEMNAARAVSFNKQCAGVICRRLKLRRINSLSAGIK